MRKSSILFFVFIFFFAFSCKKEIVSEITLLNEEFENNNNNWDIGVNDGSYLEMKEGKYIMQNSDNYYWWWFEINVDLNTENEFDIESTLAKLSGSGTTYGLI